MFDLKIAIIVSVIWGFTLLSIFSYKIAKECNSKVWRVVSEHLIIGTVVVVLAYYVGFLISTVFG